MQKTLFFIGLILSLLSCNVQQSTPVFKKYDETSAIVKQQQHALKRMQFKQIQSNYLDLNTVFKPFEKELSKFTFNHYQQLKPFLLEKDIPSIQEAVYKGLINYEKITLFYLYRIRLFESDTATALHAIIALNPNVIAEAREKDKNRPKKLNNYLYGLPILLKDNINSTAMPTTAGSYALLHNSTSSDAFVVTKLKENGALILGKLNLSEWAYYLCSGCPVGWSAVGGQTLNPYGRKIFETGGSSSGSGVAAAANYAVATVGTETSGSILSPSSKNSVVGLKPTVGLLSRSGIVPISSTLDTPGPMTKFVVDNAIVLAAMTGADINDSATSNANQKIDYAGTLSSASIKGKRLGVLKPLLSDSIYKKAVDRLKQAGATIIVYEPPKITLNGFTTLLNIDMKNDLPLYLNKFSDARIKVTSVQDIMQVNLQDSISRIPYGHQLFTGIVKDTTAVASFEKIKMQLHKDGIAYFKPKMDEFQLDAVLSMNNNHAGFAAVAKYPCITVPMGFSNAGEPAGLTFIGKPFDEQLLLSLAYAFEKLTNSRKLPEKFN